MIDGISLSVTLSLCAFAFTIVSFWYLNLGSAKLRSYAPHKFAAQHDGNTCILWLPLVIDNRGAKAHVVTDMRVRIAGTGIDDERTYLWEMIKLHTDPINDADDTTPSGVIPTAFVVGGRDAVSVYPTFRSFDASTALPANPLRLTVDVKYSGRNTWRQLVTFTLQAQNITRQESFTTYSNRDVAS